MTGEVRVQRGTMAVVWRYAYRMGDKVKRFYCGSWPERTLDEIRTARNKARTEIKAGRNPSAVRELERAQAREAVAAETAAVSAAEEAATTEALSFRQMYADWLESGVKRADGNTELKRIVEKDVLPLIGDTPVRLIREKDLERVIRAIVARDCNRLAEVTFQILGQLFHWAEKRQPWRKLLSDGNPVELVDLEVLLADDYDPDNVRERVLPPLEIVELQTRYRELEEQYLASDDKRKRKPPSKALQAVTWICLSTLCRIGELHLTEITHLDLNEGTWFIPKANVKGRKSQKRDHLVFLSPLATKHFKTLISLSGSSRWLLPSRDNDADVDKPMYKQAFTKQIKDRQAMFNGEPKARRASDNSLVLGKGQNGNWTPHDLRRTGSTIMESLGVDPNIIDRCQNHVIHTGKNRVRRHYQLYDYADEKRAAWATLGEYLERLFSGTIAPTELQKRLTARQLIAA
ncbi:Prophage CP4-57 integrase [Achromobacter xylosoxidans]|nr:Prophage CP4-57 integrase [Achromobacter xylosoxidans]CUJ20023.1 Prophage CP4-57 integrase [Achromobacter xylosoxidans]